jgi:hypothetical protein
MDLQSMAGTAGQTLKNLVKGLSDEMQQCIQNCVSCHQICEQTLIHCLEKGGAHADPTHIKLLRDCADICVLSADFMLRNSQFHARTCSVCAEICTACAQHCENMSNDEAMKACAEACRRCAESCSKMGAHH